MLCISLSLQSSRAGFEDHNGFSPFVAVVAAAVFAHLSRLKILDRLAGRHLGRPDKYSHGLPPRIHVHAICSHGNHRGMFSRQREVMNQKRLHNGGGLQAWKTRANCAPCQTAHRRRRRARWPSASVRGETYLL